MKASGRIPPDRAAGAVLVVCACIAWLAPVPAPAAPAAAGQLTRVELFWHEAPTLVPVRLMVPAGLADGAAGTLIVALHGYGGSAGQFEAIARELAAADFLVAVPEATYPVVIGRRVGFDWTLNQQEDAGLRARAIRLLVRDLPAMVAEIRQRHAVGHVYVLGYSQGAMVALLAGIYGQATFDGIVTFGLPAFDASWFPFDVLEAGRHLRILVAHGSQDEIAAEGISRQARDYLARAGYDVEFRSFSGDHVVPVDQLAAVGQWVRATGGKP